jgi:hypothetical protein
MIYLKLTFFQEKMRKNFEDQLAELRQQLKDEREENRKMVCNLSLHAQITPH